MSLRDKIAKKQGIAYSMSMGDCCYVHFCGLCAVVQTHYEAKNMKGGAPAVVIVDQQPMGQLEMGSSSVKKVQP